SLIVYGFGWTFKKNWHCSAELPCLVSLNWMVDIIIVYTGSECLHPAKSQTQHVSLLKSLGSLLNVTKYGKIRLYNIINIQKQYEKHLLHHFLINIFFSRKNIALYYIKKKDLPSTLETTQDTKTDKTRRAQAYLSTSILNSVEVIYTLEMAHGQTSFVLMGDDSFVIIVVEKYISIYILAQRRHFKPIHFRHFKGGTGLFCDLQTQKRSMTVTQSGWFLKELFLRRRKKITYPKNMETQTTHKEATPILLLFILYASQPNSQKLS
ncbi:hypothetical protein ACJX0J_025499, partial [Zea mays]